MSSIRIAMIAPPWLQIPPEGYGGVENVLHALVPELVKLGAHVELFTVGDSTVKCSKKHWLYEHGQYNFIHTPQYDSLPISAAHLLFALDVIKKDGAFDIIHDHNGFLGPITWASTSQDLPPVIHTLHGPPFTTPDRLDLGLPDNLPMWRQMKTAERLHFVGISKTLTKMAPKELRPLMLKPVYNAVNTDDFPFVDQKSDYFITLARFHPEKGQHIAVKLCTDLGYKLKMAGAVGDITTRRKLIMELANPLSPYRSLIDFRYYSDRIFPNLVDCQIEHIGEIGGQHKMDLISHARALLFPIQWEEPFGMAPIEALACGTPVIAMARGALPEIIEHGVNGFLANNPKEFKYYLRRVGNIDPAKCRESVERNFSARTMAKQYLLRYKKVIDLYKK